MIEPFITFKTDWRAITNKYQVSLHYAVLREGDTPDRLLFQATHPEKTCTRNFGRCFESPNTFSCESYSV